MGTLDLLLKSVHGTKHGRHFFLCVVGEGGRVIHAFICLVAPRLAGARRTFIVA